MKDGLRRDKAKTHILPISQARHFMEMTRQRHERKCPLRRSMTTARIARDAARSTSVVTMSVEIQRELQEIPEEAQYA